MDEGSQLKPGVLGAVLRYEWSVVVSVVGVLVGENFKLAMLPNTSPKQDARGTQLFAQPGAVRPEHRYVAEQVEIMHSRAPRRARAWRGSRRGAAARSDLAIQRRGCRGVRRPGRGSRVRPRRHQGDAARPAPPSRPPPVNETFRFAASAIRSWMTTWKMGVLSGLARNCGDVSAAVRLPGAARRCDARRCGRGGRAGRPW